MVARGVCVTSICLAVALQAAPTTGQQCARECPAGERDAHGCCRTAQPPPVQAPSRCASNEHRSAGHCCRAGEEWAADRSQCACVNPAVCGARPAGGVVTPAWDLNGTWRATRHPNSPLSVYQEGDRLTYTWFMGGYTHRFTGTFASPTVVQGTRRRRNPAGCWTDQQCTITVTAAGRMRDRCTVSPPGCDIPLDTVDQIEFVRVE